MTFTTFCRLLSQAVIHSRQPVALNWARNSFGLVMTVFLRKICILGIAEYFLIVLFQISEIKKDEIRFKKYIFLLDMFLIVGGEGSSNRNASRDESVEAGDKSVEAGDESIEAGEKTPQSCYNSPPYVNRMQQYVNIVKSVKFKVLYLQEKLYWQCVMECYASLSDNIRNSKQWGRHNTGCPVISQFSCSHSCRSNNI